MFEPTRSGLQLTPLKKYHSSVKTHSTLYNKTNMYFKYYTRFCRIISLFCSRTIFCENQAISNEGYKMEPKEDAGRLQTNDERIK